MFSCGTDIVWVQWWNIFEWSHVWLLCSIEASLIYLSLFNHGNHELSTTYKSWPCRTNSGRSWQHYYNIWLLGHNSFMDQHAWHWSNVQNNHCSKSQRCCFFQQLNKINVNLSACNYHAYLPKQTLYVYVVNGVPYFKKNQHATPLSQFIDQHSSTFWQFQFIKFSTFLTLLWHL